MRRHLSGLEQRLKLLPLARCRILGKEDSMDLLLTHRLANGARARHHTASARSEPEKIEQSPARHAPSGSGQGHCDAQACKFSAFS